MKLTTCLLLMASMTMASGQTTATLTRAPKLVSQHISLANGKSFDLNVRDGFSINVAAQGLKRVRFMAKSPDNRIFVTDMYNLTDNKRGTVYILDGFDPATRSFAKVTPYLKGLRNPNSIAFYKDEQGIDWFYLALTDRLVRYKYVAGEDAPTATPETLATFPDYGLSYKYGGWHLTRTVAIGGRGKVYVSVGSSCNACEEKEAVRASIIEMDADGKSQRRFAHGLRNAVGLRWIRNGGNLQGGSLFATNMGSDHLGDHKPADTMYEVNSGDNFGWPYCFQSGAGRFPDPKFNPGGKKLNCRIRPAAYAAFDAHSSPLGLEYFDVDNSDKLRDTFLVGLHGSTKKNLKRGYRVVQLPGRAASAGTLAPEDFITGFLEAGKVHGRPVDILRVEPDAFLLTDDYAGVVYYVSRK